MQMDKEIYLNSAGTPAPSGGGGTTTGMSGELGGKGDLIALGVSTILNLVSGSVNERKMRELQEKLAKLSLKQQKELEEKMLEAQSETKRLEIMYQTFAIINNQKLYDERKAKQLTLYYVLGLGSLLLVGMAIYYKGTKK